MLKNEDRAGTWKLTEVKGMEKRCHLSVYLGEDFQMLLYVASRNENSYLIFPKRSVVLSHPFGQVHCVKCATLCQQSIKEFHANVSW